jgi:hypothetical protein
MRKGFILVLLSVVGFHAEAAFICEQIKDKATRTACVADRTSKEKAATIEKDRIAAEEQEKALATEKIKALDDFVRKSKDALTRNYKDPSAAQFTNLVVGENSFQKTLCGSVNGKNSYGGYIGVKRFYVSWMGPGTPEIWHEFETSSKWRKSPDAALRQTALEVEAVEADMFNLKCLASVSNKVTKIE